MDKDITLFGTTYQIPDTSKLNETNAVSGIGSLGLQAEQCSAQYDKYPTFLLVDVSADLARLFPEIWIMAHPGLFSLLQFYEYGSVFQVAANLNEVTSIGTSSSLISSTSPGSSLTHSPNHGESLAQLPSNPIVQFGAITCGIIVGVMLSI